MRPAAVRGSSKNAMRRHGTLKRWNDDRGFGFIEPNEGPPQVFVHIKGYETRAERPQVNERVTFDIETTPDGKTRAVNVRLLGASSEPTYTPAPGLWKLLFIPLFLIAVTVMAPLRYNPFLLMPVYLGASILSYWAYAADKSAARRGQWRISENTLHLLSLAGGWPGALLAQWGLRHKTSKASFQAVFWLTVVLNVAGFFFVILFLI
jgi:uncharacterized membrane protein YsdA (DUF1294 family)/cold shock CspA family protein